MSTTRHLRVRRYTPLWGFYEVAVCGLPGVLTAVPDEVTCARCRRSGRFRDLVESEGRAGEEVRA
ncbi:MAG: hypothetical protein JSV86_05890 [Gemmatimonadota bacterium]|nr:MAG: hypothetical protein JSV86_05890 [Gemmatimonadota bacterium]